VATTSYLNLTLLARTTHRNEHTERRLPKNKRYGLRNDKHEKPPQLTSSNPSLTAASSVLSPTLRRPLGKNQYRSREWKQTTTRWLARWKMATPAPMVSFSLAKFAVTGLLDCGGGRFLAEANDILVVCGFEYSPVGDEYSLSAPNPALRRRTC